MFNKGKQHVKRWTLPIKGKTCFPKCYYCHFLHNYKESKGVKTKGDCKNNKQLGRVEFHLGQV